jgi:predicted nucleotidyltransferase
MATIRNAKRTVRNLVEDLRNVGYNPSRAVLFGSVAKGTATSLSDIDAAIWDARFVGCAPIDYENILPILRKYPRLELHTFEKSEDANSNPFIEQIEKSGIEIDLS